jgi:hypothetical protein
VTTAATTAPLEVRVEIAHAAVERMAERHGFRLLHVKGPALDDRLRWPGRFGTDADVLVPRRDAEGFLGVLQQSGWELHSRFENNSSFEHAATLWHTQWGYVDVHRTMPGFGIEPDAAFDLLWSRRASARIASIACPVPDHAGQALILILHAGRSRPSARATADLQAAWYTATPAEREAVEELVRELEADVGFAAAVGDLDAYRDAKDYHLWRVASRGGTRIDEWVARMRAAPSPGSALKLLGRSLVVNTDHLAMVRGHAPSRSEVVVEFFARFGRVVREEAVRRRRRTDRPR